MARLRVLALALALAGPLGCGFEPMDVPDPSGMRPGPGLISGKDGVFTIPLGRR